MTDQTRIHYSLDGRWLLAASESLLTAVERGEAPQTPEPGSPPPAELLALASAPGSAGSVSDSHDKIGERAEADLSRAPTGYRVREIAVPAVWEQDLLPKPFEGPTWFLRSFTADESVSGGRQVLAFEAVSYVCTVWLNGERLGTHRGMWDQFALDVTGLLQQNNTVAVEVYKPWDRFPVRESLAGFIPYVTTTFGGLWQSVYLETRPKTQLSDVFARLDSTVDGASTLVVSGTVVTADAAGTPLVVAVERAETGEPLATVPVAAATGGASFSVSVDPTGLPRWSPEDPSMTRLTVSAADSGGDVDVVTLTTGLREVGHDGRVIAVNERPTYLRGILHWLSYPDLVAPMPDEETIRHEIREMQRLGFNMIKLCLVVPPDRYFRVADEMGMMLWLELPMWLPQVDEAFRERAKEEYRRILRQVRNHPSIVMYTLGCELSSEADARFLRELYDIVKEETGSPLVRDNSGSAECYGGVDLEFADYHDYHFYAEATEFTNLLDYFVPAWKPIKPLVFGEYCDSDTFRSVAAVKTELGHDVYWSHDDPVINPQGVRWDYNVVTNEARLASLDIGIPFEEISRRSKRKSFEYRKWVVEQTRTHTATSGYVITNIQNTPITTSGMLDDFGRHKFDVERFREFNAPTVIAVERDRRRIWQRGADRTQHLDPHVFVSGEQFRVNAIVAHRGEPISGAILKWELVQFTGTDKRNPWTAEVVIGSGEHATQQIGSEPLLVANPSVELPRTDEPRRLELRTELVSGSRRCASNTHGLWLLPDCSVEWGRVGLSDGRGLFASERGVADAKDPESYDYDVLIATADGPAVDTALADGKPVILLLDATTSELTEELPFFREAIPLIHDHPVMDGLPHDGYACSQWGGVTPDRAIIPNAIRQRFSGPPTPIVSRLDARTSLMTHYLCEIRTETSRVLVTTFALAGSFGRTPQGLRRNVLGRYLLTGMIASLT